MLGSRVPTLVRAVIVLASIAALIYATVGYHTKWAKREPPPRLSSPPDPPALSSAFTGGPHMPGSRVLTRRARRLATLLVVAAMATALGVAPAAAGGKPMPASVHSSAGSAAR